jgi:hypothetical protein
VRADKPVIRIKRDASTVSIVADDRPILHYRYGDAPFKPYVKELFTPAGVQILRDSPHDHVHHRGLMFGIFVNGVDFWSERDVCGKQIHVALNAGQTNTGSDSGRVSFAQQLAWTPPDTNRPLLAELRTIDVHADPGLGATLLTWCTRLEPAEGAEEVRLTGTHYDGLGMRFVESMDRVGSFQYASGEPGPIVRGTERVTPCKWCAYTAPAGGKPVTVALFDHPDNARHPAGMFSMLRHFAYLSATPNVWKEPLALKRGKPLELCYGVAVWDGEVDGESIEGLYRKWLETAQPELYTPPSRGDK